MSDGLSEIVETTVNKSIDDSVADSGHIKYRIEQISRTVATLANLVIIPFGYEGIPHTILVDAKQRAAGTKARLRHYAKSIASPLSNLMDSKDRYAERLAASRHLRRSGYVVRGSEIYYPQEIKINGIVTSRTEELVGKLVFDGWHNRAEILWKHYPVLERKLRDSGYISVAPSDKI